MELEKAITTRRSIRGFKPIAVPEKLLLEILDIARWAPSGRNYQPWEIAVVGSSVLDELKRAINEKVTAAVKSYPDVPRQASLPEIYEKRRRQNWEKMWKIMGIETDAKKQDEFRRMRASQFFAAPNAIIIYIDKAVGLGSRLIDIGCVLQNILLIAHGRGLGCCPMGAAVSYPDVARRILGIPDTKNLIIGIAIGYIDGNEPVNAFDRGREPVESFTTWQGID